MRVLAVDPGKATGFALWDDEVEFEFFKAWTEDDWQRAGWEIEYQTACGIDLLVYERFNISRQTLSKTKDAQWAMGLIGVIQYFAGRRGIETLGQNPGDRLGTTAKHLRAMGWVATSHGREATRHLAVALVKRQLIDPRRMLQ